MATLLIAGATGTLGRELVYAAARSGDEVVALIRESSVEKIRDMRDLCREIRFGDLTQSETLIGCCRDIDIVVSTVGMGHRTDGPTHQEVDYQGNLNLLEEAKRAGVQKFVFVSVLFVGKVKGIAVVDAKHKFELALMRNGIDWLIYRPSGFFKDIQQLYNMASKGRIILFGDGNILCTPISTKDLADLMINNMAQSRLIVEIGGPQTLSWNQIAQICFEAQHKKPKIHHLPRALLSLAKGVIHLLRPKLYIDFKFLAYILTHNSNAPELGTTTLKAYCETLAGNKT